MQKILEEVRATIRMLLLKQAKKLVMAYQPSRECKISDLLCWWKKSHLDLPIPKESAAFNNKYEYLRERAHLNS